MRWRFLVFVLVVGVLSCGKTEIGEECDDTGKTGECVDGAICDTEGDQAICMKICVDDTDCDAATEACTGVSGSNRKACHLKT